MGLLLAMAVVPARAEDEAAKHPIDLAQWACLERDSSTVGMTQCAYDAHEAWDKELNANYAKLIAALPAAEAEALRAAQRRWIIYRDAEYGLIDAVFAQLEGTMWIPVRVEHRSSLTQKRANWLAGYQQVVDETCEQEETQPECGSTLEDEAELDPLDRAFLDCLFADTTTSAQVGCAYRAGDAWDERLNENHARLRDSLSGEGRGALREAQRRWLEFRDAEFTALDAIYRLKQGTRYYPMRMQARFEVVRDRAIKLVRYHGMDEQE